MPLAETRRNISLALVAIVTEETIRKKLGHKRDWDVARHPFLNCAAGRLLHSNHQSLHETYLNSETNSYLNVVFVLVRFR